MAKGHRKILTSRYELKRPTMNAAMTAEAEIGRLTIIVTFQRFLMVAFENNESIVYSIVAPLRIRINYYMKMISWHPHFSHRSIWACLLLHLLVIDRHVQQWFD